MISNKKIYLISVLQFVVVMIYGQESMLQKALSYYELKQLDSAKVVVDAAVSSPDFIKDPYAWYLRGYIYKELYKTREIDNKSSTYRMKAVTSLKKSISIDVQKQHIDDCKKTLKYLASRFYNDAVVLLDTNNYTQAVENYENFKKTMIITDSTLQFEKQNFDFQNALGRVYGQLYEADTRKNALFFELAKNEFSKTLLSNPNDTSANYNIGRLYYNKAVGLIKQAAYDIELVAFLDIQEEAKDYLKKSLPYMQKVYDMNPKNLNALEGLYGIYHGLNDTDKSTKFLDEKNRMLQGDK